MSVRSMFSVYYWETCVGGYRSDWKVFQGFVRRLQIQFPFFPNEGEIDQDSLNNLENRLAGFLDDLEEINALDGILKVKSPLQSETESWLEGYYRELDNLISASVEAFFAANFRYCPVISFRWENWFSLEEKTKLNLNDLKIWDCRQAAGIFTFTMAVE